MKNIFSLTRLIVISLSLIFMILISINSVNAEILNENMITDEPDLPKGPIDIPGNGSPVRAEAGILLRTRTQSNFQINATFGEDVDVSVKEKGECEENCTLENHYRLQYIWQIETNNTDVKLNATFGFPFDPNELPSDIKPESLKFAFYNGSTSQWQFVHSWMNQTKNMVCANTTHFSLWTIFAEINPQQPNEAKENEMNNIEGNGTPIKVQAGIMYQFKTQNKFQLNASFNKGVEMNLTEPLENQIQERVNKMTQSMISTGKYVEIELNDSSVQIQATLAFEFSNAELGESIDPLKLQFAYYNEENNQWQKAQSWVEEIDPNQYIVYANTTHFSLWTVLGEGESSSSVPGFEFFMTIVPIIAVLLVQKRK